MAKSGDVDALGGGGVSLPLLGGEEQGASALAAGHDVEATLKGPRIAAVTATCAWDAAHRLFACAIRTPAHVKAHRRYTITASDNLGSGFVTVPGTEGANPEIIHFR